MLANRRKTILRGELRYDISLAEATTWRVGGPAERLYRPADLADLALFMASLPLGEPVTWLGLGSNLLVRDGGIPGTVIAVAGRLQRLQRCGEDRVRAEAGVTCARLARFCARNELGGLGFLAGIPGTVGGALAINAGAFGSETWDRLVAVETIDHRGRPRRRSPADFEVSYRHVQSPGQREWFTAGEWQLPPGVREAELLQMRSWLEQRSRSQPIGQPTCGSVFRNPPGDHAGRLIEAAGLKGKRIGDAQVSAKHANFIVNLGKATAEDIEALIIHVRETVAQQFQVYLQCEVRILGAPRDG